MYIDNLTSNQILQYVQESANLQVNGRATGVGGCADFVLGVIENATHRHVQNIDTVFNKCLTRIDRGTLLPNVNYINNCLPGEIFAVVDNNAPQNNNVKHYMLYVGNINIEGDSVINTIGMNGNLAIPFDNVKNYKETQAYRIIAGSFDENGHFLYDRAGGSYCLYCVKFNLN